ncbi:MAG: glycosyltransferase family 2 protein [Tissierellia bacterium]|nr:glycosyltransferase family 2 protein [Tissierellia bacterium]
MNFTNQISYSIIIPHKNIPDLLKRCIDSIPQRDDIQVIVVDDNSDQDLVDLSLLTDLNRPYIEIYYNKEGKGAGFARNIGLTKAKGKWIIFADSDDFFNESLNESMDKYKDSKFDMVFFRSNSVDSDSLMPIKSRGDNYNKWIEESNDKDLVLDEIRYRIHPPWSKFYSREMIEKNKIRFDEVVTANDTMFSVKSGHLAKSIGVDLNFIYCATVRSGSLAMNNDLNHYTPRYNVTLDLYKYLENIGKIKYRANIWILILYFRKLDKNWLYNFLWPAINTMNPIHLFVDFFKYVHLRLTYGKNS